MHEVEATGRVTITLPPHITLMSKYYLRVAAESTQECFIASGIDNDHVLWVVSSYGRIVSLDLNSLIKNLPGYFQHFTDTSNIIIDHNGKTLSSEQLDDFFKRPDIIEHSVSVFEAT